MKRHLRISTIAAALTLAATLPQAQAATYSNGTAPTTFVVSLNVQPSCTIGATPLTFPATGTLATALAGQTTLSVNCTNTTPYNVGLSAGTTTGSTVANRLLAGTTSGNTSTVGFGLYQDAAHATNWGDTQGTDTIAGTGTGSAQSLTVYGQVPAQQTPQPDTYQTTITATVYY